MLKKPCQLGRYSRSQCVDVVEDCAAVEVLVPGFDDRATERHPAVIVQLVCDSLQILYTRIVDRSIMKL